MKSSNVVSYILIKALITIFSAGVKIAKNYTDAQTGKHLVIDIVLEMKTGTYILYSTFPMTCAQNSK